MTPNPFSTRFIRPGAIPFFFASGESAATLVECLREHQWRGQIIGPHGSGKSTLLATLLPELTARGRRIVSLALHQGEHALPPLDAAQLSAETQLIIDGYEQLSWWNKRKATALCRQTGAGLLITAHADLKLPTIYETSPNLDTAAQVVARLLDGHHGRITSDELAAAFLAANGNLREALFKLYDVYQQRQQSS